jgi:3-isopropylmalate/(R)-2-methylmalate dehydratase small subunit
MLKGKAWKYGDNVDTDVIIPARYLTSSDPGQLKEHCMEDIDKDFAKNVKAGDFIVAENNFGCGSSREHAPISIKAAGVSCVIAKSFARIFFRNSFNIGLPILESTEALSSIETGDELEVDISSGTIKNLTKGSEYKALAVPEFMQELIDEGGLVNYVQKQLAEGKVGKDAKKQEKKKKKTKKEKKPGDRMKELETEQSGGEAAPWGEDGAEETPKTLEEQLEEGEMDDDEDDE